MADENRTPVSSQKQQLSSYRQRPTLADLLGKGSQKQRSGVQEKEPRPPRYTETGGFTRFKACFENHKEAKQRWVVRYLGINSDTAEADTAAEVLDELDTRLRHDLVECAEENDSFFDVVQRARESGGPENVVPFEEQWEFILRHYETSQMSQKLKAFLFFFAFLFVKSIYKDLRDKTDFDEVITSVEALAKAQATSFGKRKDEDDRGVMETGPLKAVMKKVVKGGEKTEKGEERAAKGRSAGSGGKSNDSNDNTESGVKPIFKSIPDRLAKRYMRCAEEEHHQASCPYSDDTIARFHSFDRAEEQHLGLRHGVTTVSLVKSTSRSVEGPPPTAPLEVQQPPPGPGLPRHHPCSEQYCYRPFVPVKEKAHLNFSSGPLFYTKWHLSSEYKELQEVKADKDPLHKQKGSLLFFGEVEEVLEKYKFTHHEDLLKLRRHKASADQIAHLQSLHNKEVKHISSMSRYGNAFYSVKLPKLKMRVTLLKDHTRMLELNTRLGYIAQDRFLIDFCDLHMKGLINNTAFLDLAKCFTVRVLGHKNAPLKERWSASMHIFCAEGGDKVRKKLRDNLVAMNTKYFDQSKKNAVDNLFDTTKAKVAERLERGVALFCSKPPLALRGGVYALSLLLNASKNRKGIVYHQTLKLWFGGVKEEQFVAVYNPLDPFEDDKLAQFITITLVVCHDLVEYEEIVLGACLYKNGNLKGEEIDHLQDVCQCSAPFDMTDGVSIKGA
uniref:Uncharacterized protein n=1 Tax=Chromera velia CCMP2878 TaxID=1169474 RepID=A0A0G4F6Y4_9ALVE|eukprot:Cvel_15440.t1-p1 / transcript=Cvel_15440.t1 / gene=Cvel_15440 / organism=Chromera_velia_CCMP2878 / gene_product=hypothetical protein / transcript_product=hypothetical protein / location=Cvel_scaffold1142:33218-53030(+) / protein_length=726 / sequence_SO=supercontig / SO=protein_coding / is_pseudo=false